LDKDLAEGKFLLTDNLVVFRCGKKVYERVKRADSSGYVWMARGFGAQHLMVFPEENLIAVFTGWRILGKEADDYETEEKAFARRILTAVKSKSCGDTARSDPR
jgi:hypothetical protein